MKTIKIKEVRSFWDANPLCASNIPYPLGTKDYFEYYDNLREVNESIKFSDWLHEYNNFSDKKVLDIGSGNGYVLSKYAQEGAEVYGIDITSTASRLCQQRFNLMGLEGNFYQANAEELPFQSETFDCVCSMGVLHHTPNTENAIDEIFRVLKPGGRLIVMFYHRDSWLYRVTFPWVGLITGKSHQQLVNEVDGIGNPKGEVYSKTEMQELLFQFEKVELFVSLLQKWMLLPKIGRFFPIPQSLLQRLEQRWGWFLYAKAIKPLRNEN